MRPLLLHASRSLAAYAAPVAPKPRSIASFVRQTQSICARSTFPALWPRRHLSSSPTWMDQDSKNKPMGSSDPIPMPPPPPPPSSQPSPPPSSGLNFDDIPEHLIPPHLRPVKTPEPPKEEPKPAKESKQPVEPETTEPETTTSNESPPDHVEPRPQSTHAPSTHAPSTKQDKPKPNVTPVPNEQLPSHHQGQRWDFSKRLQELMDEVLPKLAVVTQKVNTYTGTDYSGVAALRSEIKEQEKLVKDRRLAIESAKHALDAAHAQQASSQKEVVALLERKHSWTAGDLERYMSLIRSEHLNDKAVREAKDAVADAESALEDARRHLEKRERAQYHEEQIWSDTIRRNSTWVTFGLMGVNIFLLLLSLLILEPWRRRRMVREIKNALEAHKVATDATPVAAPAAAPPSAPVTASAPAVAASVAPTVPATTEKSVAALEEEIDKVVEPTIQPPSSSPVSSHANIEESPTAGTEEPPTVAENSTLVVEPTPMITADSAQTPAVVTTDASTSTPASDPVVPKEIGTDIPAHDKRTTFEIWQWKATSIAQDIVSDRSISMRRVDYTTAMLQAAAAGAVIAAALIAMMRPY